MEQRATYMYQDKNGTRIEPGDTLTHIEGGEPEMVYRCAGPDDEIDDLGFLATNMQCAFGVEKLEYYPLSQFNMDEYEITGTKERKL